MGCKKSVLLLSVFATLLTLLISGIVNALIYACPSGATCTCENTDGGENYLQYGAAAFNACYAPGDCEWIPYWDVCTSTTTGMMREYVCAGNSGIQSITANCEVVAGLPWCDNGKCVECRLDSHCAAVERCIGNNCVKYVPECASDSACRDTNACTNDVCDLDVGECTHNLIICNDRNACTSDSCNAATGCVYAPISNCCTSDLQCADTNPCTDNTCYRNLCQVAMTPDGTACTSDGNPLTLDYCRAGTCVHICTPTFSNGCSGGDIWTINSCTGAATTKVTDCSDYCGTGYTSSCNPGPPATCTCTRTGYCGDGDIVAPEACDDGNTASGDGCAYSSCTIEPGWTCSGEPSVCKRSNGYSCTSGSQCASGICAYSGTGPLCVASCGSNGAQCSTTTASYTSYGICAGGTCDTSGAALSSGTYYSSCSGRSDNTPADTNSLAGGYSANGVCCGGSFASSCVVCTANSYTACYNGDSYYYDSCDVRGNIADDCASCETCSSGTCSATDDTYYTSCYNGDSYWYDSCNVRRSIADDCASCETCSSGSCAASDPDYYTSCYNGDAYWYDSCNVRRSIADDCASCETCSSGSCAATTNDYRDCYNGDAYWYDSCGTRLTRYDDCTSSEYCDEGDCYANPASCGDGSCNGGETCSSCSTDCGSCCGNSACDNGETCSSCSTDCGSCCDLNDAYWSTSATTSGTSVSLTAKGTSACNTKTITFEVRKDNVVGWEYVATPSSRTMSSGTATTTWTAIAPFSGDSTPLYYFIVRESTGGDSFDSRSGSGNDRLDVSVAITCGNGVVNSGETCDDGDTSSGDGCSSSCTIESGYTCTGAPSVCTLTCGNSVLNAGEGCDDGDTSSGDGCSSTCLIEGGYVCDNSPMPSTCTLTCPNGVCSGETCSTCPQDCGACITCGNAVLNAGETCDDADSESGDGCSSSCLIEGGYECDNSPMPSTCWRNCGDSTLDSGEECDDGNTNNNDGCSSSCAVEEDWVCDNSPMPSVCDQPNLCAISSASWSTTTNIEEGDTVHLNIETANCDNGESVTFTVYENDATGQDDLTETLTATINNNAASPTWVTEYQEDTESNFLQAAETNPPEYYFEVIVDDIGESSKAQSSMTLTVHEDGSLYCIINTINTCADYTTKTNCEEDSCSRGESSQGPGTKCGLSFEEETRCLLDTVCGCEWNELTSSCTNYFDETYVGGGCVVCGNGIKDYTEQCDDGNALSGDGCYNCTLEDNIDPPCGPGLTLCSDNTCSYRCDITDEEVADCNYDGVCQAGTEGCNCADCADEQDTCLGGLICSLSDLACCNPTNDDVCNLYCVTIDPDCENDNTECGNGLKEFDEQCDDGNVVSEDGCSMICQYETLPGPPDAPCPEGTTLCSDGTCSLNCWFTDEGYGDCTDSSCCAIGLLFSSFDSACCNPLSNAICNPYCTYIDPDCSGMGTISISSIGKCVFDKTGSTDDCSDGYLTRDYTADWQWDTTNVFFTNPNPLNNRYVEDTEVPGIWHYDPLDVNGVRKSAGCQGIHDTIPCPAQIKLNAFGKTHLIIGFLIIGIVYTIIIFRRKK